MVAFKGEKGKRYCKLTLFLCRSRTIGQAEAVFR
jgi:hypothetical protein